MDSILLTVKQLLGVDPYCDHFDTEILVHTNSALMVLNQLGVGPPNGFVVTGNSETWSDFIGTSTDLEMVKTYVYVKVKLVFDPPQSSAAIESLKQLINEYEWRLNVQVDPGKTPSEEEGEPNGNQ